MFTKSANLFCAQRETLIRHNIPHIHIMGSNTDKLLFSKDGKKWGKQLTLSDNQIEPEYLNFISRVKRHALSLDIPEKTVPRIYYNRYADMPEHAVFKDCIQFDLNQAYWNLAYKSGYLSDGLYQEGFEVPKQIRLIAFGSLASRREVFEWMPCKRKYHKHDPEVCERTRSYFFDVSSQVDTIMDKLFSKYDHALFFWVDALFLKNGLEMHQDRNEKIKKAVYNMGLGIKAKHIKEINRVGNKVYSKCIEGKVKKYYISGREIINIKPKKFKFQI